MSELSQVSTPVAVRRFGVQGLFNTTVLITALVAALPVLLMGLTVPVGNILLIWVVGAFVIGAVVGMLLHNTSQGDSQRLLGQFAQTPRPYCPGQSARTARSLRVGRQQR